MGALSAARRVVRVTPLSRGIRLVIFAGCLTAFLVLSSISLTKFIRQDTVKSFEVDESAPQEFAVTICRIQEDIFRDDVYLRITGRSRPKALVNPTEALTADFPWGSVDLEEAVWNMTRSWGDIVMSCADFYNGGCNHSAVTSDLYQYGGQCHTVRYSDALAEGVQRGIWLVLNHPNCTSCGRHHWNVYVHSANDHYMDWEHVWAPPRAQLETGKEQNLKVTRMLDIALPSDTNPCNTDSAYSRPNCIRQCLFSELAALGPGCRLPWMPVKLPVCDTARDYQLLLNYTRMFSRTHIVWDQNSEQLRANEYYAALKRIAARCKVRCGPQCYQETITLALSDRLNHKKNETWVALSIAEGLYVSRTTLAYDMQQMVSDIGGNLGLLLGASAFTLYEFIESCVRRCWRRSQRRETGVAEADLREVKSADGGGGLGSQTRLATVGLGTMKPPAGPGDAATTHISI
ncbi:uncharacterized protein LOC122381662 isoform X1 [Amphibalanus amphitrite]|uniref:uncharacterized protein LOC122381662 isoform X1 n=1 Tax=Amphibalanus amphitrite TaxID=1232801 RepID=UPI001C902688|nr:uncharacterized protein LOC122381662 isoform X1 [Amphibalanus amphitrite]